MEVRDRGAVRGQELHAGVVRLIVKAVEPEILAVLHADQHVCSSAVLIAFDVDGLFGRVDIRAVFLLQPGDNVVLEAIQRDAATGIRPVKGVLLVLGKMIEVVVKRRVGTADDIDITVAINVGVVAV